MMRGDNLNLHSFGADLGWLGIILGDYCTSGLTDRWKYY